MVDDEATGVDVMGTKKYQPAINDPECRMRVCNQGLSCSTGPGVKISMRQFQFTCNKCKNRLNTADHQVGKRSGNEARGRPELP
jgi:hypothetical protein